MARTERSTKATRATSAALKGQSVRQPMTGGHAEDGALADVTRNIRSGALSRGRNLSVESLVELRGIFEKTVGAFLAAHSNGWQNPKIRDYVLGVACIIGREAAQAPGGEVTAAAFRHAAVAVMKDFNRSCNIRFVGAVTEVDGPLCTTFLESLPD